MPTITMTVSDTFTTRCAKINRDVVTTVPEATIRHWIEYGRKQDLNDGHSSIKRDAYGTEREFHAAVDAYVAKWKASRESGIVPGGKGPLDGLSGDDLAKVLALVNQLRAGDKKKVG